MRFGLDRWGLVPDKDAALIQIGGDPEAYLALQNKAVDAAALSEPFAGWLNAKVILWFQT